MPTTGIYSPYLDVQLASNSLWNCATTVGTSIATTIASTSTSAFDYSGYTVTGDIVDWALASDLLKTGWLFNEDALPGDDYDEWREDAN